MNRAGLLVFRIAGACVLAAAVVVAVVLATGHGRSERSTRSGRSTVADRSGPPRLQVTGPRFVQSAVQPFVAGMLAGIPQHGVVLGDPTAPVTLQVYADIEDHNDGTRWFDEMLPAILKKYVRADVLRVEFHSFKTDTLNGGPFVTQQTAALAAGAQNRLWNYALTFMNEQGNEFSNYVNEAFVVGIAEQVPGLDLSAWERSRGVAIEKLVMADDYDARHRFGFYATPAFRIGLTGGPMKNFAGHTVTTVGKYIIRTTPSGERYIAGQSRELQHPVSLVEASDVKKAVEELLCRPRGRSCPV